MLVLCCLKRRFPVVSGHDEQNGPLTMNRVTFCLANPNHAVAMIHFEVTFLGRGCIYTCGAGRSVG